MKLIINADDFGMTESINKAVIELCELDAISSTSVMVNMPYANQVEKLLVFKNISIGLHVNITEGRSVSQPFDVTTLVDEDGCFYPKQELMRRIKAGEIKYEHIKKEVWAQYYALNKIIGNRLSHFDSHQGSTRIEMVYKALLDLVQTEHLNTSIRVHCKYYLLEDDNALNIIAPSILSAFRFGIRRVLIEYVFRKKRTKWRKSFTTPNGMLFTRSHKTTDVLNAIAKINLKPNTNKTFEISCHPAIDYKDLLDTNMLEVRVEEYNLLKSEIFLNNRRGYDLISFNDIRE